MHQLFIIELICLFLQFVKAQHDAAMTDIQDYADSSYKNASKAWHDWSLVDYVVVVTTIAWLTGHWAWIVPLLLVRAVFFSPLYQILRSEKKGIFYLSDKGLDLVVKKILGKYAGILQFTLGLLLLIASNVLIFKYNI